MRIRVNPVTCIDHRRPAVASTSDESDRADERPLVSPASILIFSAFLAGVAFAEALPHTSQVHAICAAAAGVAAYLGLWYTTRLQEQLAAAKQDARLARKAERRLGKHMRGNKSPAAGVVRRIGPDRA
jgi:hypothetical protein